MNNKPQQTSKILKQSQVWQPLLELLFSQFANIVDSEVIAGAYLFGSLVNESGKRFDDKSSDVDVVLVTDFSNLAIDERVAKLNDLRRFKLNLERELTLLLQRENASKQVCSLVPITQFELSHGVHKGGHTGILTRTRSIDLVSGETVTSIVTAAESGRLLEMHRSTLQEVQSVRSKFVGVSVNGTNALSPSTSTDPIPKALARSLAAAISDDSTVSEDATNLTKGIDVLRTHLLSKAIQSPIASELKEWVDVRSGARGRVDDTISLDHYAYINELIFDKISQQYPLGSKVVYSKPQQRDPDSPLGVQPLPCEFLVGKDYQMLGKSSEKSRSVLAAQANMKAQLAPSFRIKLSEPDYAEELLQSSSDSLSSKKYREKIEIFENRARFASLSERLELGTRIILWYGHNLFYDSESSIEPYLVSCIDAWFQHCRTGIVNIGGGYEAWHPDYYPDRPAAFSFSANGGRSVFREANAYVTDDFEDGDLCRSFVPELVSRFIQSFLPKDGEYFLTDKDSFNFFVARKWRYGLK